MNLSVIVPVFNMAADDKLTWCMDSLTAQTLFHRAEEDMEIIAVDDASTDDSLQILNSYAERFQGRFRVVHSKENLHQGGAKNIGLSLARGAWIGFIDADDYVTEDYFERLLTAAEAEGADLAGCDLSLVTTHTWDVGEVVHSAGKEVAGVLTDDKYRRLILDSGALVTKIYRRQILFGGEYTPTDEATALDPEKRPQVFPEGIFYEDNAVAPLFMTRATRYACIPEPLYYYLQHGTSTVHTITNRRLEDRMEAGRQMLMRMRETDAYERFLPEIEFFFTTVFYVNTLFSAMPSASNVQGRYALTKALGEEMRRTFPFFERNPYYAERINAEEKKLIRMQGESHLKFYLYYKLLWAYRALRYGRSGVRN